MTDPIKSAIGTWFSTMKGDASAWVVANKWWLGAIAAAFVLGKL